MSEVIRKIHSWSRIEYERMVNAGGFSADARLEHRGERLRTAIDFFYAQARVEGYRTYGVRLSIGADSWLSRDPTR